MPKVEFSFSYVSNSRNEPHILALLLKIEDIVKNKAEGDYDDKWEEIKGTRKAFITIDLPNNGFEDVIDGFIDDVENLVDEDRALWEKQNGMNVKQQRKDEEDIVKKTSEILSEKIEALKEIVGDSDDETSDESWKPSKSDELEKSDESELELETTEDDKRELKKRKIERNEGKRAKKQKVSEELQSKKGGTNKDEGHAGDKGKKGNVESDDKEVSAKERRKVSCPFPSCRSNVAHLPRHMRNVHKWTKEAAAKVLLKYNIRKRKSPKKETKSTKKNKDYHRRRRCPVPNCHTVVFRMPAHLQKVHKMDKSSKDYSDALASATFVPDKKHSLIRWKEERKHRMTTPLQDAKVYGETSADYHDHESSDDSNGENEEKYSCSEDPESFGESKVSDKVAAYPVLVQFEQWLQSPDGGKRDEITVKQHSAQLVNMLQAIDDSGDISSLLDIKLVRQAFIKGYVEAKKYEAGTIKSYLMSLRHYFSFLISDRPAEVEFNVEDLHAAREKIRMWSISYKRESCTRRWQKLEEDAGNLLTPANIQMFEKSEAAREAVKLIGQYSDPMETMPVTQKTYTLVRDFLFTQIFIDNASRPGVLSYMKMSDFKKMREEGDEHVVAVMKHKTVHVHGPAYIVLSKKLKAWLSIFVEIMRAQVTTSTSGPVFLSWNAKSMTSGQINKAVQSVFKKAEMAVKITSTSFRKAAVTKVHESNPELSGKLAGLMAHNEATAKKYYLLSEKTKASVEASRKLGKLMRSQDATESESVASESGCSMAKDKCEDKKRMPWTVEELQKVEEHFSEELKRNAITLGIVRAKVETNKQLHGMSPRRIYNRLKKQLRHETHVESDVGCEPPKACESLHDKLERITSPSEEQTASGTCDEQSSIGIVPPTERSSGIFSDGDIATIQTKFADMILHKPISKVEIKKRCSASQEGKKLLSNLSVNQLMNRIKYERKKTRSENE